ncbi:hypothetical protein [Aliiglaciecola litoralis]|uniref:Uncharacterized protein n=1 Tax=Aliiglaciecola litoralis TaxID=582857 RepID=A0ABP3WUL1_9ALTE
MFSVFVSGCVEAEFKHVDFIGCKWKVHKSFFESSDEISNLGREYNGGFESLKFISESFKLQKEDGNSSDKFIINLDTKRNGYRVMQFDYFSSSEIKKNHITRFFVISKSGGHILFVNFDKTNYQEVIDSCLEK